MAKTNDTRQSIKDIPTDGKTSAKSGPSPETSSQRPMGLSNFVLAGVSLLLIVVGFLLIAGSESTVESYNPDIFSTRRIVVGPMLAFLGFVLMAVAIMVKPTNTLFRKKK